MQLLQNGQCPSSNPSFMIRLEIGAVFTLVYSIFFQCFIYNYTVNNLNDPLFGFSELNLLTIKSDFGQKAFNKMYIYNTLSLLEFPEKDINRPLRKYSINPCNKNLQSFM